MRGASFREWFDLSAESSWSFNFASLQDQVFSPLPTLDPSLSPDEWLARLNFDLGENAAQRVQIDVVQLYAQIGNAWGFPQGKWLEGARDLWQAPPVLQASFGVANAAKSGANFSGAVLEWLGELKNTGLGRASVQWIMDSQAAKAVLSQVGSSAQSVPWVGIVVAVARWARVFGRAYTETRDRKAGTAYGTDFEYLSLLPASVRTRDLDQEDSRRLVRHVAKADLDWIFSPRSLSVSADVRDGRWTSSFPFVPAWSIGARPENFGLGCIPGSEYVSRRYQAVAPVHRPTAQDCEPAWSAGLRWESTGQYLPGLASLGSTLWQATLAGNAAMAGIDAGKLIVRWRLFCHRLAGAILNPFEWGGRPLSYGAGGSRVIWGDLAGDSRYCDFVPALENLWSAAAVELGWPSLRELVALSGYGPIVTDRVVARWAWERGGAFGPRNYDLNTQGGFIENPIANRIGLECTPVLALRELEARQKKLIQGQGGAAILLPYCTIANPAVVKGQDRVDALRDLLLRPEICEVDPDDLPLSSGFGDDLAFRSAMETARAREQCNLNPALRPVAKKGFATYVPPPLSGPFTSGKAVSVPGSDTQGGAGLGGVVAALAALAGVRALR